VPSSAAARDHIWRNPQRHRKTPWPSGRTQLPPRADGGCTGTQLL